jgi:putative hemolysin
MRLARSEREVALAQRLRHRVFVEELGGRGGDRSEVECEADRFDRHCEHLLLLDAVGDGRVIGTTRLMSEDGARAAGGFASEDEFDLSALRGSGRTLLEVGRTCLLPEFRGGSAMHSLWLGLAGLVHERGVEVLFGLASFPGTDPAMIAQSLALLHHDHLAPEALRPVSRRPVPARALPAHELDRRAAVLAMPALLKAYLRLGGKVGDGAFIDTDFRCIDVCLVLDTASAAAGARAIYAQGRA